MEINKVNNSTIEIRGFITKMKDIEEIKEEINKYLNGNTIVLKIIDSFSIPSMLISYLIKLKELENKHIILEIKDKDLYELLQDLDLKKFFTLKNV